MRTVAIRPLRRISAFSFFGNRGLLAIVAITQSYANLLSRQRRL